MVKQAVWGVAAAWVLAAAPAWADLKIGVVNYDTLLQQAPQAKQLGAALRAEFLPRQRELDEEQQSLKDRADKFQRDAATMTDDQRDRTQLELQDSERELQRKQSDFQDEVNARRNEGLSRLQRVLEEQVRVYAKAQNIDLVLVGGAVIYATSAIDLTPAILSRLQEAARSEAGGASSAKDESSP